MIAERVFPDQPWRAAAFAGMRGACLVDAGRYGDAETVLLGAHELLEAGGEPAQEMLERTRSDLVRLYEAMGMADAAATWR